MRSRKFEFGIRTKRVNPEEKSKRTVLFVDDDENVLHGLKVMLHTMRNEWIMSFAPSGEEALKMIAETDDLFKVVVTDMHMPGMHGDTFLREVTNLSPQTVRFVLSGNLNSEVLARSGAVAHQIIAKPCDPHHLRALLSRAFGLESRLPGCQLKDALFQMCGLPSVPLVYWDLQNEMNSPEPSIERVGQIVEKDPSMSAKVLQVANSAHGSNRRISRISEAVAVLGVENIRSFVLMAGIFETADQSQMPRGFSLEKLWEHGMRVGDFAKRIAEAETQQKELIDDTYTAGLLHDIGLLIIATKMPDEFRQTLQLVEDEKVSLLRAEKQIFGASHAEIGGFLLDPQAIVDAISYHVFPSGTPEKSYELIDEEDEDTFAPLTAVHVANYICEDQDSELDEQSKVRVDGVYLDEVNASDKLETWWDICFASDA